MDVAEKMGVQCFPVGVLHTNCYVVWCGETAQGLIIDPSDGADEALQSARRMGIGIVSILATHGHWDHVAGADAVRRATGAPFLIHEGDEELAASRQEFVEFVLGHSVEPVLPDGLLSDGQSLGVGKLTVDVIHTPGHTVGGVCFVINGIALTGDTLLAGSVGRTDLPGGDWEQLLRSIRERLLVLPDPTGVLPGHGPASTIGEERSGNPFLRNG